MIKNKLQIIMTIGWIFLISIFMAIAVYALTTTKELKFFAGIKYDPTIIVDVYINDNLVFSSRAPGEVNQDYIDNIVNDTINFNSNIIAGETYNIRIVNYDTQKDILYTINNNGELSGVIEKDNGTNSNEATEVITITETGLGQTLFSIKLEILYDLKDLDGNDDETGLSFGEAGKIEKDSIPGTTFYVSNIDGLLKLSALVGKVDTTTKGYDSKYDSNYGYDNSSGPAVTFSGATITMLNNIDCENGDNKNNFSKTFIPINNFQGTFDGNNKTITGLYINQTTGDAGLFGYVKKAEIKNLKMQNCKVVATGNYVGNFVGRADNLTISNCSAEETEVSDGTNYVGGIVGFVTGTATITNCYNEGSVSGGSGNCVGGIVGEIYGTTTITNCYNTGSVSGFNVIGGIVGNVRGTTTITNCYNIGSMSVGNYSVGGIVGSVHGTATITNCYNTESFSGSSSRVSGIVGRVSSTGTATITNCYYLKTSNVNAIGSGTTQTGSYYGTFDDKNIVELQSGTWPSSWELKDDQLVTVLNAYVNDNPTYNGIDLNTWMAGSNGYPVFA